MKNWTVGASISLGAFLMGSTAFAQVTPEDIWTKFQTFSEAAGQSVATDSVERNGDTLEIRGLVLTADDEMTSATQTIAEVNLTDNGDGTVGITMSETIPLTMQTKVDPVTTSNMTLTQSGLAMTASGSPDAPFIDFTATSMAVAGSATDPSGNTDFNFTVNSMAGGYAFTENDFQYNFTSGAGNFGMTNPTVPFPVNVGFGGMGFDVKFPLKTTAEAVPFTFLMKLQEFTLPPEVWGMADPTGQLPQDPATLVIDTAGSIRLLSDFSMTPAPGEVPPPPELHSLSLREVQLKMVGADLTGNGDLTFDLADTTTFGGVPAPTGVLNFNLVGGNGLLDKLAAMGLVPEDQLMGVRMMMGMFATMSADGSDSMTSMVEFKDKGLFVNGQQLQ